MQFKSVINLISVLMLTATLAACEDSESRAERYYQSGLALLEEGDVERALIEFRNVFNLNGAHREARSTYARVVREQGDLREAYGQYLRLVEQFPDDLEGRIALSEMAFISQKWEEFDRHSAMALEAAPQDPRVKAIEIAALYRAAAIDDDGPARDAAFEKAVTLVPDLPDNQLLQQVEIDSNVRNNAFPEALDAIDRALETNPKNRTLANIRLSVLGRMEDAAGLEAHLRSMVTTFPEDDGIKKTLIRFYESRNEADKAEAFLRGISDPNAENPSYYLSLVGLISQLRGPEAAIAELDQMIPQVDNPSLFQGVRARFVFNQGQKAEAIEALEATIDDTEPSTQQRDIKIVLARMLLETGNDVGARQLVEQVLAEDPGQVMALRMSAKWQIDAGDTDEAIATLRLALDQNPQDVDAMSQMSQAYKRSGNRDLARDFLSLAVDASGQDPTQSLRYAQFLIEEERYIPAEQALVASLRQNRNNQNLLVELGRTYLLLEDLPRMRQVIAQLEKIETDEAQKAAVGLQTALIERESGSEEAINYLENISKDWDNTLTAQAAVIRARIMSGDIAGAINSAENALAEDPEDPTRRYLMAATQAAAGKLVDAEASYRALLSDNPAQPAIWIQLIRVLSAQGNRDAAVEALAEGLEANPKAADLLWARASALEQAGDIDGAIEVYEAIYAENTKSVILSNNLASLLATSRDDAESLARAAKVARPLRGLDQPAFRDTWGWIAFRQGDLQDSLTHLEPAAAGLATDAQVQYHLGRVYEALARKDEALAQYEKTLELAGPDDTRPAIADARTRLEALKAE